MICTSVGTLCYARYTDGAPPYLLFASFGLLRHMDVHPVGMGTHGNTWPSTFAVAAAMVFMLRTCSTWRSPCSAPACP